MARYGQDFGSSRWGRRNLGDVGIGYDQESFGQRQPGGGPGSARWAGRRSGWEDMDSPRGSSREEFGWQGSSRGFQGGGGQWRRGMGQDYGDRNWRGGSSWSGGDRYGYGDRWIGRNDFDEPERGRFRSSRYDSSGFGSYRGRESIGDSWRSSGGYDRDFGDRVRRGWDRVRNEAREMFGRGYDRGW